MRPTFYKELIPLPQPDRQAVPLLGDYEDHPIYAPTRQPGFVAWATAFSYGDGSFGVSFDEALEQPNPDFVPPRLEFSEAAGVPVSYCSVECGSDRQRSYRVYMKTTDGKTFTETGRCPRREGSLCNVGFPDGRIVGFDVPRYNEDGTGWADCIRVRESADGGSTWTDLRQLLKGTAPYLWRVRRLRDGTVILLASLYGTPWGEGRQRATRNTMLPGESYINKIQTFFMTSSDCRTFSEPHYILPGLGAHEYDVVELQDGRLLFIAGDVQGTPVGRQFVAPSPDGWLNGALYSIKTGAPSNDARDPQGGYVPETIVWQEREGCILGYRRNKCFCISNDYGENWTMLQPDFDVNFLYQPFLLPLDGDWLELFGHVGGDAAFGQSQMTIQAQRLRLDSAQLLPKPASLSLRRALSPDGKKYINAFRAQLTSGGEPVPGQQVVFRFSPYWNQDGSVNALPQSSAPYQIRAVTDRQGWAEAQAAAFDGIADIYLSYNTDVICPGSDSLAACDGPCMTVLALTPRRETLFPYDGYFAEGVLFLAPGFIRDFPEALPALRSLSGESEQLPAGLLCEAAEKRLLQAGVLRRQGASLCWIHSVHAPRPLADVKEMTSGDWYI